MSIQTLFNRVTNPRYAIDEGATPVTWQEGGGDSTGGAGGRQIFQSLTGGPAVSASYAYRDYALTGTSAGISIGVKQAVNGGETYTFGGWGNVNIAGVSAGISVSYYDNSGNFLGTVNGIATAIANATWEERVGTFVVPTGAVLALAAFTFTKATGGITARAKATAMYGVSNFDTGGAPYTGGFFDGNTAAAGAIVYSWTGATNLSSSVATITTADPTPATSPSAGAAVPVPPTPPVGGVQRTFKPLPIIAYSVNEESTPVDSSDQSGGTGYITLNARENDETRSLNGVALDLVVPSQGITRGTMRDSQASNGIATINADSRITLLIPVRTAQPFVGTLAAALTYYCGLVGITSGLVIDASFSSINVVLQGWTASVYFQLKKLLPLYNAEVSLVSDNVVFRPTRQRVAQVYRDSSQAWAQDSSQLALSVIVNRYVTTQITNGPVYPVGGWTPDVEILSVAEGETKLYQLAASVSLSAIQQPSAVDFVDRYDTGSVYAVAGNDDLPIPAAEWNALGGSLTVGIGRIDSDGVTILSDPNAIYVSVTGAVGTNVGPFRIAMTSGASTDYSSLRLLGTGLTYLVETHTFNTGVDPDRSSQQIGATLDNEFITTIAQVIEASIWLKKRYGSILETISVTTKGVNRLGDNGSYRYPTFADFDLWWNTNYPGATFGSFDTIDAGQAFSDFDAYWVAQVSNDFANQAFGNVAGSRVPDNDKMFRIRTTTITAGSTTYSAEEDSVISDFDTAWPGATFGSFDVEWNAMRPGPLFSDFDLRPLRRQ